MSARDVFGIVLRSFGLWLLYTSVWHGFSAIDVAVQSHDPWGFKPETYVLSAVWESVLGFYLLRGAPLLLDVAYPLPTKDRETTTEDLASRSPDGE